MEIRNPHCIMQDEVRYCSNVQPCTKCNGLAEFCDKMPKEEWTCKSKFVFADDFLKTCNTNADCKPSGYWMEDQNIFCVGMNSRKVCTNYQPCKDCSSPSDSCLNIIEKSTFSCQKGNVVELISKLIS